MASAITAQVYPLKITFTNQGKEDALFPVLVETSNGLMLVDCGYEGFLPLIEAAAAQHGFTLDQLTSVLITHEDLDHVGGLAELKSKYPQVRVMCSEIELPWVSGQEKSPRLKQAEDLFDGLPAEYKPGAAAFQEMLQKIKRVSIDRTFPFSETILTDDVMIIPTSGHTPGHVSIYIKHSKTLISADAVVVEGDHLEIANPQFTLDLKSAVESVKKIQRLDIGQMICYHGGVVQGDVKQKLQELVERYR